MGNGSTVQLKWPGVETGTIAKGRRVAPTGICVRAVHRGQQAGCTDHLGTPSGIGPRATRPLSRWNRLAA